VADAAGPVLYVLAHQDDELLILPKMILDVRAGRELHVIWTTDGRKGGNPAKREAESRTVMKMLGIPAERFHFLGFPDTKSLYHLGEILARVVQVSDERAFAELVSPAYEGGNMDHDVCAFIAARIVRQHASHPVHFEFPLYNKFDGRRRIGVFLPAAGVREHRIALDAEMRTFVQDALKVYRTQRLALWFMSLGRFKKDLLERGCAYRVVPQYDFLRRPADEPCEYESSLTHRAKWADWQREITQFVQ
jgi:LmbE family N-acetylglucosaminyl deacetylase